MCEKVLSREHIFKLCTGGGGLISFQALDWLQRETAQFLIGQSTECFIHTSLNIYYLILLLVKQIISQILYYLSDIRNTHLKSI
jgi:hypothetical protein